MTDTLVLDAAERLFADQVTPALVNAAEKGEWPSDLWQSVEQAGFLDALAPGDQGFGLAGLPDALAILRASGRHAVPLPIAETMVARWLMDATGLGYPITPLTIAPVETTDVFDVVKEGGGWRLRGTASAIPWARNASHVVALATGGLFVLPSETLAIQHGANLAGEPRDRTVIDSSPHACERIKLPPEIDVSLVRCLGALCRAAQMAGALEASLALATQYANDRVQFGRPIGRFQAIQQQLAQFAEQVAAATVAVTASADAASAGDDLFFAAAIAKIRAGEASGKSADIAHQVHGAIGFTHEHRLHHLTRRLWSWRDEFGVESEWSIALGSRVAAQGAEAFWPSLTA
ncbi:MAG TPA: acyl-CoA dehydrogenase family protein [Stellaceae bacterium]|jgi:alkylation response protein AidB-like acyl-CoA dehydrogenase|nr:acyl-CoA dehydrogenase family protein [Stellaceae bacterium]